MNSNRVAAAAAVFLLAGLAGGCSDPHESNTKDYLELRTELNEVLATVQDEASLEAALPRIENLNGRIKWNVDERGKLEKQPEAERRKTRVRYQRAMKMQSEMFGEHMGRIGKTEGLPKDALKKMYEALKDVPPES